MNEKVIWNCHNGCKPPTSDCRLLGDQLYADGCCGGGCVIVELNYCPVCGDEVLVADIQPANVNYEDAKKRLHQFFEAVNTISEYTSKIGEELEDE